MSHPARGAWIEIRGSRAPLLGSVQSHPARGAWIEILSRRLDGLYGMSHPARGAWIEIAEAESRIADRLVAPRKGCVD